MSRGWLVRRAGRRASISVHGRTFVAGPRDWSGYPHAKNAFDRRRRKRRGIVSRVKPLLRQQIDYCRARADAYVQWFLRQGRYESGRRRMRPGGRRLSTSSGRSRDFGAHGQVPELAGGPASGRRGWRARRRSPRSRMPEPKRWRSIALDSGGMQTCVTSWPTCSCGSRMHRMTWWRLRSGSHTCHRVLAETWLDAAWRRMGGCS